MVFRFKILIPKSKEERTEVTSRLLFIFVTHKLQEHLNFSLHFLNFFRHFHTCFTVMISRVYTTFIQSHFENSKALLKNQDDLLKACKHVTFL